MFTIYIYIYLTLKIFGWGSSTLRPFDIKQYRPSFAGYVDVDLAAEKKISLRSLVRIT